MKPNVNPDTNIRYGIIAADSLDPDLVNGLQTEGEDVHWIKACEDVLGQVEREADQIEEECRIALAEIGGMTEREFDVLLEKRIEQAYRELGHNDREDFVEQEAEVRRDELADHWIDDEPVHTFEIEGVKGQTTWLGGALLVWVFESPFTTQADLCSPCVPNCGDLDSLNPDGEECYDVPEAWRVKED